MTDVTVNGPLEEAQDEAVDIRALLTSSKQEKKAQIVTFKASPSLVRAIKQVTDGSVSDYLRKLVLEDLWRRADSDE